MAIQRAVATRKKRPVSQVGCNVLSGNVLETPMGWEIASIACALLVSWQQVQQVLGSP